MTPSPGRAALAMAGGAALSFFGMGILWIGTPWPLQALMFFPFLGLTAILTRTDPEKRSWALEAIAGAGPLGLLLMRFRDANDSHLKPILIVCAWAAGAWLGGRAFGKKADA